MWKTDLQIELNPREPSRRERPNRARPCTSGARVPAKGRFAPLFAAFDTRTGEVTGILRRRKREAEFLELLEKVDRETPATITRIHLVCDNLSVHKGKQVQAWLQKHPRFQMHFTPVHVRG
jgi:hypothetical protein